MDAPPELRPGLADVILADWPLREGGWAGPNPARPPNEAAPDVSRSAGKTGALPET
jgi:hypothetical protein